MESVKDMAFKEKSKIRAKVITFYCILLKRNLEFPLCLANCEKLIEIYKDDETYAWKYLVKANCLIGKLYILLNSLEHCMKYLNLARAIIDRNIQDKESRYHADIFYVYGFSYWKFFKQ